MRGAGGAGGTAARQVLITANLSKVIRLQRTGRRRRRCSSLVVGLLLLLLLTDIVCWKGKMVVVKLLTGSRTA